MKAGRRLNSRQFLAFGMLGAVILSIATGFSAWAIANKLLVEDASGKDDGVVNGPLKPVKKSDAASSRQYPSNHMQPQDPTLGSNQDNNLGYQGSNPTMLEGAGRLLRPRKFPVDSRNGANPTGQQGGLTASTRAAAATGQNVHEFQQSLEHSVDTTGHDTTESDSVESKADSKDDGSGTRIGGAQGSESLSETSNVNLKDALQMYSVLKQSKGSTGADDFSEESSVKDVMTGIKRILDRLTALSLEGKHIGGEGAKAIAGALKHPNNKVTELYLGHNDIGDEGAKAIAEALKHPNNKVTWLDLGENQIGEEGKKKLDDAKKLLAGQGKVVEIMFEAFLIT